QKLIQHLRQCEFRLLPTRSVFFYDPSKKEELSSKVQYHHRRDLKLIEKEGYEVLRNGDLKETDLPRLLELYRKVYMEKHTSCGLYRMLSVLLYKESEVKNLALNDSSGGDDTKKWRGLKLFDEYVAIYDRHLPLRRRLFWKTVDIFLNKICRKATS